MPDETPAAPTEQAEGAATSTEQAAAAEGTTTAATETAETTTTTTEAVKEVAPEYKLTLPEGSTLDDAALERMTATARESGLSAEQAQKALELVSTEVATRVEAERATLLAAYSPGGEEWQKQTDAWKAETLKDQSLGKTEEERTAAIGRGTQLLRKFSEAEPENAEGVKAFLDTSGLGNHPAVVRFFAWLGKAAGEGQMVMPGSATTGEKSTAELLYGSTAQT